MITNTQPTLSTPDKERVRLLVDALRGGRFEQGHNSLFNSESGEQLNLRHVGRPGGDEAPHRNGDIAKHCCLGVGCVLAAEKGNILAEDYDLVLPSVVITWYGFDRPDPMVAIVDADFDGDAKEFISDVSPEYTSEGALIALSVLNDHGWSFERIADVIERTYLS